MCLCVCVLCVCVCSVCVFSSSLMLIAVFYLVSPGTLNSRDAALDVGCCGCARWPRRSLVPPHALAVRTSGTGLLLPVLALVAARCAFGSLFDACSCCCCCNFLASYSFGPLLAVVLVVVLVGGVTLSSAAASLTADGGGTIDVPASGSVSSSDSVDNSSACTNCDLFVDRNERETHGICYFEYEMVVGCLAG